MKKTIYLFIFILLSTLVKAQSPGGISTGINLWLKADAGVTGTTNVTDWTDFSGNANHAQDDNITPGGAGPSMVINSINFNPSLRFDLLEGMYTPSMFGNSNNLGFVVYAITIEDNIADFKWYFRESVSNQGTFMMFNDAASRISFNGDNTGALGFPQLFGNGLNRVNYISNDRPILTTLANGSLTQYGPGNSSTRSIDINGISVSPVQNIAPLGTGISSPFNIANSITAPNGDNNGGQSFNGNFAEVIFYTGDQTPAELNKIESYLAVKYGITLDNSLGGANGDYVATNGTILWDASLSNNYHNNVIGLGRDDNESLLQKQSRTFGDTTKVYLNTLQTTNNLNTGTFSNDISYVLLGEDQGKMCETGASNAEMPVIPNLISNGRVEREWKVTKTSFTDNFNTDFTLNACASGNLNTNCLYLLVDDDGNFSNGGTDYYTNNDGTGIVISNPAGVVSVNNISNTHIPNNTTQYITLASYVPEITASNDTSICLGQTANISATGINLTYLWDNGIGAGQSQIVAPVSNTTYVVTGTAPNGCFNMDSMTVTINNTLATSVDTQTVCGSYTWIDGNIYNNSNNIATHTIIGGAANGCDSIVTLNLTIITAGSGIDTQAACESYTWIDGNIYTANTSSPTDTIFGGSVNGCDSIVTLNLTISPEPNISLGEDILFCNEPLSITPGPDYVSYTWDNGNNTSSLEIFEPGSYGVTVTDTNGCVGSSNINIIEDCPFTLFVPNTFTPNEDNNNNVFKVVSDNVASLEVLIFNRWGELIYSWNKLDGFWDGKNSSGSMSPDGVYPYILKYRYFDKEKLVKAKKIGHINLLK